MHHPFHEQTAESTPQTRADFLDETAEAFHARMDELMSEGREFIVFRGAGTNNGIMPEDLAPAVKKVIAILQEALESGRKLVIMFDGDDDNRDKPDIGAVFGCVADEFRTNPDVLAVAAQKAGWYYPTVEGAALESASGTQYETYVIPDSAPLEHGQQYPGLTPQTDLTQSTALAQYDRYQQLFVGPAGPIASAQLGDLNEKANGHKTNVLAITTRINPNLNAEFEAKKQEALVSGDTEKADAVNKIQIQREQSPFGALHTITGEPTITRDTYINLNVVIDDSVVAEARIG